MPQVPILLEAEPKVRAHAGHLGQAEGRIRRDRALGVNHLVQSRERHAKLHRECGLRDSETCVSQCLLERVP